jgi:hypothetical protein
MSRVVGRFRVNFDYLESNGETGTARRTTIDSTTSTAPVVGCLHECNEVAVGRRAGKSP